MTLTSKTPKHKLEVCQRGDWLAFRGPRYLGRREPNQKTFSTFPSKFVIPTLENWGNHTRALAARLSHLAQGMSSEPDNPSIADKGEGEPRPQQCFSRGTSAMPEADT